MCSSDKVFIFKNEAVASECADDVATFLRESIAVFKQRPDIIQFNEKTLFNADGLECPTFVVPGGSMLQMAYGARIAFSNIRNSQVGGNFNYIGSCSGAMLATNCVDIFTSSPSYLYFDTMNKANLNLIDDYKAVGAFCAVPKANPSKKNYVPYSVSLAMPGFKQPTQQLLVNGPGFFAVKRPEECTSEVVALYSDRESYTFNYNDGPVKVKSLPAMISRKPTADRGGVFLSGVHFYASVENSKLLGAFEESTKTDEALSKEAHDGLKDFAERENTRGAVEVLLRRTLK